MLGEIFDIDRTEIPQPDMQRQESHIDPFDLKPFHQVLAEMQSCGRRGDGTLVPGENGLVPLVVDRLDFRPDPFGQRGFPIL